MIGFIVTSIIFYFIFAGLDRLFRGKPPTVEYYIVREYVVDTDVTQVLEHAHEQNMDQDQLSGQPGELPDNVILFDQKRSSCQ